MPVLRENSEETVPETVYRWNNVYSLQIKYYVQCFGGTMPTVQLINNEICVQMEFVECTDETMVIMYF